MKESYTIHAKVPDDIDFVWGYIWRLLILMKWKIYFVNAA